MKPTYTRAFLEAIIPGTYNHRIKQGREIIAHYAQQRLEDTATPTYENKKWKGIEQEMRKEDNIATLADGLMYTSITSCLYAGLTPALAHKPEVQNAMLTMAAIYFGFRVLMQKGALHRLTHIKAGFEETQENSEKLHPSDETSI